MRRVLLGLLGFSAVAFFGCATAPPAPHPKAVENNNFCAQYMNAGDLDRAEIYCDHALEFTPNYPEALVNKGIIAFKRGQTEKAKELFIRAIKLNQEQAQAYNNLGVIYLQEKKLGNAHDMFQRALKVNPDYMEARYNLAYTWKEMGDKAAARKEYRTILAVNPNIADAHNDLGIMAYEEHAFEEAIAEFTAATKLDPKFVDAWTGLGNAYSESGKFQEAHDAFTSCLEADPNNIPCRNNIVIVNRKLSLLNPTLKELQEDQGQDQSAPGLYARARQFAQQGLKTEEERYYKKCVKADSHYAPCHFGLYLLFKEDMNDHDARIACQNFLKFAVADEFPKEVETCEKFVSQSSY